MYLLTVLTLPLVLVPLVARGRAWLVCGLSVRPRDRALLERFVNKSHRSTDEVAGDATQAQNTNERNLLTCYYGRTAPREDKRELP